ncbi:MAG: alpha/beta hydrolase [Alphaproteobacteria bacterium]|nr:alpha/beta hydrolase [Alphaproteobacteria bacterium]MDE2111618.1 alpha/beta hydrolase [Alphaproteobacteria bacterium]MDE2494335.1 alpha/beta hydrolase [Alphaproteobacteria bacterium]
MSEPSYLKRGGDRLAYLKRNGIEPGVVWLGGFMSDMTGTKAQAVDAWAARAGLACLRFDYSGHGRSSGVFTDGTISRWRDDALAVIDAQSRGPQILVGSSMGGWIAMLVARLRPVAGLVLIAPAADMTELLMWRRMPEEVRREIMEQGVWLRRSEYGDGPYPITRALIEDGRSNLILGETISLSCPVRILQGMADPDVPWQHAMKLADMIEGDVAMTLVKNGDHRLSTPSDIRLLERMLDALVEDAKI